MKQHVNAVGILHIGLGIMGILTALIIVMSTLGPGLLVLSLEGDVEPLGILTIVGCSLGIFFVVLAVPGIIGGIGLLKLQPWARYLVMILAVLDLFAAPIGTVVGIYSFWVLMQGETETLFATGSR
jgi:hypothetical protein